MSAILRSAFEGWGADESTVNFRSWANWSAVSVALSPSDLCNALSGTASVKDRDVA